MDRRNAIGSAVFGLTLAACGLYYDNWRTWALMTVAAVWAAVMRGRITK